jgi:hypothetical protein
MMCRWVTVLDVSEGLSGCRGLTQLELIDTLKTEATNFTKLQNI